MFDQADHSRLLEKYENLQRDSTNVITLKDQVIEKQDELIQKLQKTEHELRFYITHLENELYHKQNETLKNKPPQPWY